ncbi:MAG TPA: SpoIIE family protein phosphatase [Trebonia sp.]
MNLATAQMLTGTGLTQSPLSVAIFDAELRIVWANEAAERSSSGLPPQDWRGRRLSEVMPEIDADLIEQSLRRVLASGEPVLDLLVTSRARGALGGARYWSCNQFPVSPLGAAPGRVVHIMQDVTEPALSQRQLALAHQASAHIGRTLDTTKTAEELLDVAVPHLADVGAVDLLATVIDGDDLAQRARHGKLRLQRVALRWSGGPAPADYTRPAPMETNPASLTHQHLVAGLPMFLPAFGAMSMAQVRQLDFGIGLDRLLIAHREGAHSLMIVPLIARGVIMGVVVMYRLRGSKSFTSADLLLASDLVSRASLSIDNARLYTRERACALVLQRALLPCDIPKVPGLDLCYRYAPAETAAEVGGDWIDVIALCPGRNALIIGDVTGHDIRAAAVMGQLRTATRTLASLNLTPAEVLGRLDHVTADLTDHETFATCIYAIHDATTGEWEIASAGHPPPALVHPSCRARFLDLPPGPPLGLGSGHYEAIRIRTPPGSTLLLYTDGLIERPNADIATGMASLAEALTPLSKLAVSDARDALLASLASNPTDDLALLMART